MAMKYIKRVQEETHEWRMNKWPELTAMEQFGGTIGELGEFVEILIKAQFYSDEWQDEESLKAEAGDVIIYFLGVLSLLGFDVVECIDAALEKNEQRDWEAHQKAPSDD